MNNKTNTKNKAKQILGITLLSLTMSSLLSACNSSQVSEEPKEVTQQQDVDNKTQPAMAFKKYAYQLPQKVSDSCKENCPTIDISYLVSDMDWLNALVNTRINSMLIADKSINETKVDIATGSIEPAKRLLDSINSQLLEHSEAQPVMPVELSAGGNYLGKAGSLLLFSLDSYEFWGGAHGTGSAVYLVADSDNKKQLTLDAILVEGQKPALTKLLTREFDKFVEESGDGQDFYVTGNFMFTDKGLTFLYQPYEIASYAMGMPEFTLSYAELTGVVQDQYLALVKDLELSTSQDAAK